MPVSSSKIKQFYTKLLQLEREVEKQLNSETLSCCGISFTQYHILLETEEAGETSITNLSRALKLDKSTLSRTIDQLVNSGLISRIINPDDRRYMIIQLTEQGNQVMSMTHGICNSYFTALFKSIPDEKHDLVIESIALLTKAIGRINRGKNKSPACCFNTTAINKE